MGVINGSMSLEAASKLLGVSERKVVALCRYLNWKGLLPPFTQWPENKVPSVAVRLILDRPDILALKGFALLSPEKRWEIASKGGRSAHQQGSAHEFTSHEAREAGRKGGLAPHKWYGRAKYT